MDRSRLRNKFFRNKSVENKKAYNKQRNYIVSLLQKSKREYCNSLDLKKIIDNEKFWKSVKPHISYKLTSNNKIILIVNGAILSEEDEIAETLNNCFFDIITNLNIPKYEYSNTQVENINDPTLKPIYNNIKIIQVFKQLL